MIDKLLKLHNNSYSPYSNYKVSCIVVMNDGKEFVGVNVENASFGATICAERSAITSAISNGYKRDDFKELHVMVSSGKIGTPCFLCRQVISEFFNENSNIYCYSTNGEVKEYKVSDLCTHPFGSDDLIWKVAL